MSWLRTMGKRVALRVSSLVARNELFERYGERPVQPPLRPGTWVGTREELESNEDDQEADFSVDTVSHLGPFLQRGPALFHHWATWCESCTEEMPVIREVIAASPIPMFGVSWDAFEAESAQACMADVEAVASNLGFHVPQLVLDAKPAQFFDDMGMDFKQVPQTWLVNAKGEIVFRIDGIIDADGMEALLGAVENLT